jgi:hypothetical protein
LVVRDHRDHPHHWHRQQGPQHAGGLAVVVQRHRHNIQAINAMVERAEYQ